jgi:CDP-diacylglycerol--glycerol-3-phosphate 3-phosphatidyltransferase/cardiolipin synthase
MGRYRARDVLLVPSLLSLLRVPLAIAFWFAVDSAPLAMGILLAAGLTDVVDGWYARRFDQVTATGAVIDPVTDKLFVMSVVLSLLVTGRLSVVQVLLLGTRDLGELPLVLWMASSPEARRARKEAPSANVPGKLATGLQFVAIAALFLSPVYFVPVLYAAAGMGVVAAISYWRRAMV